MVVDKKRRVSVIFWVSVYLVRVCTGRLPLHVMKSEEVIISDVDWTRSNWILL